MNISQKLPLTLTTGAIVGLIGLPNISVKLLNDVGETIKETISTEQGLYFLKQIPAGSYTLHFEHESYLSATKPIIVPSLSIQSVNIELQPRAGLVTGTITQAGTVNPIEAGTIIVRDGYLPISSVLTDATGQFKMELPIGNYILNCYKPGYHILSKSISVMEERTMEVNLTLQNTTGIIVGLVTHKQMRGAISQPLDNVIVQLISQEQVLASTSTNSIGLYLFNDIPLDIAEPVTETEYCLQFIKEGYLDKIVEVKLKHLFSTSVAIQNIDLEIEHNIKNAP